MKTNRHKANQAWNLYLKCGKYSQKFKFWNRKWIHKGKSRSLILYKQTTSIKLISDKEIIITSKRPISIELHLQYRIRVHILKFNSNFLNYEPKISFGCCLLFGPGITEITSRPSNFVTKSESFSSSLQIWSKPSSHKTSETGA